jgi:hypothetical protein
VDCQRLWEQGCWPKKRLNASRPRTRSTTRRSSPTIPVDYQNGAARVRQLVEVRQR